MTSLKINLDELHQDAKRFHDKVAKMQDEAATADKLAYQQIRVSAAAQLDRIKEFIKHLIQNGRQ